MDPNIQAKMSSVGRKLGLGLNFGKRSQKSKKFVETRTGQLWTDNMRDYMKALGDDSEVDTMASYRKGSMGSLSPNLCLGAASPRMKTSKSSSLCSINSDSAENPLDHDDIISLTQHVRSFSEALSKLKSIFCTEGGMDSDDLRIAAHEKLGDVLGILRTVLQKYPALHTIDVLTCAAVLITRTKSCTYDDIGTDSGELLHSIDQLALAFSSSISEYLMGDIEQYPNLGKTKSYENLITGENEQTSQLDGLGSKDNSILNTEDIDNILSQCEAGVEIALKRAKQWSKYAKDIITYVEKRASLEMDYTKSMAKLANNIRHDIAGDSCLPFQTVYCTALEQDMNYAVTCQDKCELHTRKFIQPLNYRRIDHEKTRRSLKDTWNRELKKMHEAISNLQKAKQWYISKQQDYEKAKEASQKVETDSLNQSAGNTKVEKKKKQEEDAMIKAMEAETRYKYCVVEANSMQNELERVKGEILSQIRELIHESDVVLKTVTESYFRLLHHVSAATPVQFQTLYEKCQQYEPGSEYAECVKRLPLPTEPITLGPYVFEPYTPDAKPLLGRKTSTQSSGSGSSDAQPFNPEESPGHSPGRTLDEKDGHPSKSWARRLRDDDTDSVSSLESSPTASPRQVHKELKTSASLNELAEADRDSRLSVPVSEEGQGVTFRGVVLSRAAQTHAFKKLRSPSKCRQCETYVYFQGAECIKCGLSSHKKCLETMRWECGHKPEDRRLTIFGVDFLAHVQETGTFIPHLVRKCTAEIDKRGLDIKGIYRVSGVKSKVEKLCQYFEMDEGNVDLDEHHPNVISNVLKLYLRQLPEPLLVYKLYPDLIKLAKEEPAGEDENSATVLEKLMSFIQQLPKPNFCTCAHLMHHLRRVADCKDVNQMNATNLGIIFGPTLLRPSEGTASLDSLMDTPHQTRIVELLVLNVNDIFGQEESENQELPEEKPKQTDPPVDDLKPDLDRVDSESDPVTVAASPEGSAKEEVGEDTHADTQWYVPEITQNLLDELAKEEPRFQQAAEENANMQSSSSPVVAPPPEADVTPAPTENTAPPEQTPTSLTESRDGEEKGRVTVSPGLKKKLLTSQVLPRSSNFYTATPTADSPNATSPSKQVTLTKPKPYSPPNQRRNVAGSKCGATFTKPGSADVSAACSASASSEDILCTTLLARSTFYCPSASLDNEDTDEESNVSAKDNVMDSEDGERTKPCNLSGSPHLGNSTSAVPVSGGPGRQPQFV